MSSDDKAARLRDIAESGAVGKLIAYDLNEAAAEIERLNETIDRMGRSLDR